MSPTGAAGCSGSTIGNTLWGALCLPNCNTDRGMTVTKRPVASIAFRIGMELDTTIFRGRSIPWARNIANICEPTMVSARGRTHCSSTRSANLTLRRRANGLFAPATTAIGSSNSTSLLEGDTDIRIIQALLGHDKLDTTARYTRVATGMIATIESPLDLLSQPRKKPRKSRKDQPTA
jgi:hypothetical protein